ncbi:Adenylate cyclase [gamma proteobacterium IMCC2047]|nr:Adenylate cyclase [gamma proteobacterium IMCC2047]
MINKTVLSSAEAAKILNVSLRTVQLWVEKGVLSAWKTPGGHRRITLESVQALQRQQSVQAGITESKLKLLIVEDDAPLRKLYRKNFERWDIPIEIYMAEDGYQGLIMLGEVKPDLLLTDLMMPSMSGVEMIKTIRNKKALDDLRVIVITAMDRGSAEVMELREYNIDVLHKPFHFSELKELIEDKVSILTKPY